MYQISVNNTHTQTDKNDFTDAGKISVLKSRLLGSACEYWNHYDGEEDFAKACRYLLERYPDVQDYGQVLNKVNNLKRAQTEQITSYANRIQDLYDKMQLLHPDRSMSIGSKRSDSVQKLIEILPQQHRRWIKIDKPAEHTFSNVLRQILQYVETETELKLSVEDITKEKARQGTKEVDNITEKQPAKEKAKAADQTVNSVATLMIKQTNLIQTRMTKIIQYQVRI